LIVEREIALQIIASRAFGALNKNIVLFLAYFEA